MFTKLDTFNIINQGMHAAKSIWTKQVGAYFVSEDDAGSEGIDEGRAGLKQLQAAGNCTVKANDAAEWQRASHPKCRPKTAPKTEAP